MACCTRSRGALALPWFDQTFFTFRFVGYSTWNADCPPYTGCAPTQHEAYVVWVLWDQPAPSQDARRLLIVPIDHGL
jgi:hypothetical protein